MSSEEPFQVELRLDGSQHDDIFVRVGHDRHVGDTYWLSADPNIRPDDSSDEKSRTVFAALLQACLKAARELQDEGCIYLPLDLQDEWTGAIQCRRRGDKVALTLGCLPVSGYLVVPSEPQEIFADPRHFEATGSEVLVARSQFLELLQGYAASVETATGA